ncbi:hypothetical protein AMECASPLE_026853 [Ameca splendens]|uniref:Uncharacterized protein n=1 Tax=Ameca splendens TaxID=208324 RepID=A0ABV0YSQ0_9TELE
MFQGDSSDSTSLSRDGGFSHLRGRFDELLSLFQQTSLSTISLHLHDLLNCGCFLLSSTSDLCLQRNSSHPYSHKHHERL